MIDAINAVISMEKEKEIICMPYPINTALSTEYKIFDISDTMNTAVNREDQFKDMQYPINTAFNTENQFIKLLYLHRKENSSSCKSSPQLIKFYLFFFLKRF